MNTSKVQIQTRDFVFRKVAWEYVETQDGPTIRGQLGTWTVPWKDAPKGVLGIVCCPNCGSNSILHGRIHNVTYLGRIQPDFLCTKCPFEAVAYLDRWANKPLYACAIEVDGTPEIHYMHANTVEEARIHLGPIRHKKTYRIVAIGPAIGVHVEDEHGDVAHAD